MKTCKVDQCVGNTTAHGYCNKHSLQIKRNGKITDVKIDYMLGEIWANIPDHDNYKISNYGRVLNKSRNKLLVINEKATNEEYILSVKLGRRYCARIPTTIAKAFIPNPYHDTQIVFLDSDNRNVQLGNIQWKGLFRRDKFIKDLKTNRSDVNNALLGYIHGDSSLLNKIIYNNYSNFKKTAFCQIRKSQGYSNNFDNNMVEDAVQEGLSRALSAIQRGMINNTDNFIAWISVIIRNSAKNIMVVERKTVSENMNNSDGEGFSIIELSL